MEKIKAIRQSGKYLSEILDILYSEIDEGVSGLELDEIMREYCEKRNIYPSFLGFNGFPSSLCVCINDEIVHGIPSDIPFKLGDMVTIDAGITYEGWITDSARSKIIGENADAKRLSDATKEALYAGIKVVKAGIMVGEISQAIEFVLHKKNIHILSEFCGHGLGKVLHSEPQIPNDTKGIFSKYVLKEGEIIAIEPITSLEPTTVDLANDGWSYKTNTGALSCQWEHTILVTEKGCEVLTK